MNEHSEITPEKTSDNSNVFSCTACQRPDSADDLVACDKCDKWWHYSCAGVTGSVENEKWYCSTCFPEPAKSLSVATSAASRKARLELNLQRLEEQRELDKKLLELELEKKYIKEKYQLMEDTLLDEVDTRSVRSRICEIESRTKQVADWVDGQAATQPNSDERRATYLPPNRSTTSKVVPAVHVTGTEEGAIGGIVGENRVPPLIPESVATRPPEQTTKGYHNAQLPIDQSNMKQQLNALRDQLQLCQLQLRQRCTPISSRPTVERNGAVTKGPPAKELNFLPTIESGHPTLRSRTTGQNPSTAPGLTSDEREQNRFVPRQNRDISNQEQQRDYYPVEQQRDRFAPSTPTNTGRPRMTGSIPTANSTAFFPQGPSPEQLAARQVMPRDLPEFTGDPEEWPLFFCSYNNTTSACGYNNAENLSRLQRCLKGPALRAVRYYLMVPESVPDVMKTLETLFGRPEMIISKLIKNVRETPAPRAEKLETLIEFGMAIRNLTQHLIAVDQRSHLSNPILLQEMVEKLPAGIKLQWAQHLQACQVAKFL